MKHRPWCSCPQCYVGKPTEACHPDSNCFGEDRNPTPPSQKCRSNRDCPQNLACNRAYGTCEDPCTSTSLGYQIRATCTQNHRCEVQKHKPVCVCKHHLVINERMELTCPGNEPTGCRSDHECADNLACLKGRCLSPCNHQECEPNKMCRVINHKPFCFCDNHECQASSPSICLKNSGCPSHLACVNYQCQDPCANVQCPGSFPCFVQDHVGKCKFCPPGYVADGRNGCKGKGSVEAKMIMVMMNRLDASSLTQRFFQLSPIIVTIFLLTRQTFKTNLIFHYHN